ncbi:hypothetical protein AVEN_274447-1 [Araneus ventricosus]|uniref:Uncharacterized protein n=1 Tax=Araneus ventricosus TaxID=182803 RepID=A0A4Y2F8U5_ARAVE|nr:hypothetical protein AVEN_274447-1 [Araneus ventricosus]
MLYNIVQHVVLPGTSFLEDTAELKQAIHIPSQMEFFGRLEGKSNRQGQKPMKFGTNEMDRNSETMEFKLTQNPKLHAPIPIGDPDTRLAAHQRICLD